MTSWMHPKMPPKKFSLDFPRFAAAFFFSERPLRAPLPFSFLRCEIFSSLRV
uniref:Uncharacterized protein n=1 Tax=Kalanchoe fedtschenkoi TaxID=63787 RepID=A0A7N0UQB6_KALFE